MRISRETQIQSVSSFACPASPRPLPCLFTLEYVPKMQPLRARPNAPPRRPPHSSNAPNAPSRKPPPRSAARPNASPRADRCLPTMRPTHHHENRRRAAPHAQTRPRADRRIPAMRRPFETSSDLPIISRIAPPRISFVENAHTLSVKYCAVPFARRHAHMLSPCAHNYSRHARARPMRRPSRFSARRGLSQFNLNCNAFFHSFGRQPPGASGVFLHDRAFVPATRRLRARRLATRPAPRPKRPFFDKICVFGGLFDNN